MRNFLLFLIFLCANSVFFLVPGTHIKGVFRVSDIGLALVLGMLVYYLSKERRPGIIFNKIGLMIFFYLFMVLMHIAVVSINYNQSVGSSFIAARHQLYYLSYFVFLLALNTEVKAESFMRLMTIVAIGVFILSIINYFGFTLFYHEQWSEGHGSRSGIKRAYIPGMEVIGMAFFWQLSKFIVEPRRNVSNALYALLLFSAILFRQTRGRIVTHAATAGWMMIREKKFLLFGLSGGAVLFLGMAFTLVGGQDLVTSSVGSVVEEVSSGEGTWGARLVTLQTSLEIFREHPLIGGGTHLIRQSVGFASSGMLQAAYQGDLGYPHWLKNYGLLGVIWLIAIMAMTFSALKKRIQSEPSNALTLFSRYQFVQIIIGGMTINYWLTKEGVLLVCLVLALATRQSTSRAAVNHKSGLGQFHMRSLGEGKRD
ncbi:MAG: hypothetical protein V7746_13305 [Halioglobus sp.]